MDDKQVDVAIIEASALLVTLMFIILSFYSSNYAMYYTAWEQQCGPNLKGCVWPPWLGTLSAEVGGLELLTYLVGLFFVVAASAATVRLLWARSAWLLAGLRIEELIFFVSGLVTLAVMFFFRAQVDVTARVVLAGVILGAIAVPLLVARRGRRWRSQEPQNM